MDTSVATSHPQDRMVTVHDVYPHMMLRSRVSINGDDFVAQEPSQFYPRNPKAILPVDSKLELESMQLSHVNSYPLTQQGTYPVKQDVPNSYGPLPGELGYNVHVPYTPEASPPSPNPGTDSMSFQRSRNISKSLPRKMSPVKGGRVTKNSKDLKKKKVNSVTCSKPLSELAKDFPDIHILDVGTFIARSSEQRLQETSRNKEVGHIKRPMNAFMLYRKAYQELAKIHCRQNNHQIVSSYCGASWREESDEVTNQFNEWAKIERVNHHKAHPGYKFTPSKPRGRKQETDGESILCSDVDDPDWGSPRRAPRQNSQKPRTRQASQLSETPSLTYDPISEGKGTTTMGPDQDLYFYAIPGQSPSMPQSQLEQSSYSSRLQCSPPVDSSPHMMTRHTSPRFEYAAQPTDGGAGLWDSSYHGIPQATIPFAESSYVAEAMYNGTPVDMSLIQAGSTWPSHVHGFYESAPGTTEYGESLVPDAYLRGTQDDWKVEELEEGGHFDHWITQTEQGLV